MKLLGLVGHPLTHSFSAGYFSKKFESLNLAEFKYELFDIPEISNIRNWSSAYPELIGLNVTIPYKEKIIPYLDQIDEIATKIGAVNTIEINKGRWKGYNTDYIGFRESLIKIIRSELPLKALVLGNGGSAKAVTNALHDMEIPVQIVSRKESKGVLSYDKLNSGSIIADSRLVINTTPLGMYPEINSLPAIKYDQISDKHILYDLVYNPVKTAFLLEGEKRGAQIKNGLEMLYIQAEQSWKIWTNNLQ